MTMAEKHRKRGIRRLTPIAAILMAGCSRHTPPAPATDAVPAAAKEVRVVAASLGKWPQTVRIQGSLLADEDAIIGSKIAGRVESIDVDLGSQVKRGETIVTLDRSELDLLVKQSEAQLRQACAAIGMTPDQAEAELDLTSAPPVMLEQALVEEAQAAVNRANQLLPTRAISSGEYETVIAQLKAAEARYLSAMNAVREQISLIGVRRAELALAKQRLADAVTLAPFDAIVEARHVSPGEYVQVGQALASLVRVDHLRFTAGVPEVMAAPIQVGQIVKINLAGYKVPLEAKVSRVSPTVMQTSRAVRIEADVANEDLKLQAGIFAEADVVVDAAARALSVPATAVSQFAGIQKVWIVIEGQARHQAVTVGRRDDARVEILTGLEPGAVVIAQASEGYAGPVIAKLESSEAELHAKAATNQEAVID
jgi:RND family efflux transporter MFP subunit